MYKKFLHCGIPNAGNLIMYVHTSWNLVWRQTDDLLAPVLAGLMEHLMLRDESMSRLEALRVVDDPTTPLPGNTLRMLEL